jgi:hypothetical protein
MLLGKKYGYVIYWFLVGISWFSFEMAICTGAWAAITITQATRPGKHPETIFKEY